MTYRKRRSPALSLLQEDPDFLKEVVERYEDGATLRELADELDVSDEILWTRLTRAGCKMRRTGPRSTP
jgi:DNA-directed RNA polymerase specialized sigma24 family protein